MRTHVHTTRSVPLCYVYPAMLHYKACARTRRQKIADIVLMIFGLFAAAYTTIQTVKVRVSLRPLTVRCLTIPRAAHGRACARGAPDARAVCTHARGALPFVKCEARRVEREALRRGVAFCYPLSGHSVILGLVWDPVRRILVTYHLARRVTTSDQPPSTSSFTAICTVRSSDIK